MDPDVDVTPSTPWHLRNETYTYTVRYFPSPAALRDNTVTDGSSSYAWRTLFLNLLEPISDPSLSWDFSKTELIPLPQVLNTSNFLIPSSYDLDTHAAILWFDASEHLPDLGPDLKPYLQPCTYRRPHPAKNQKNKFIDVKGIRFALRSRWPFEILRLALFPWTQFHHEQLFHDSDPPLSETTPVGWLYGSSPQTCRDELQADINSRLPQNLRIRVWPGPTPGSSSGNPDCTLLILTRHQNLAATFDLLMSQVFNTNVRAHLPLNRDFALVPPCPLPEHGFPVDVYERLATHQATLWKLEASYSFALFPLSPPSPSIPDHDKYPTVRAYLMSLTFLFNNVPSPLLTGVEVSLTRPGFSTICYDKRHAADVSRIMFLINRTLYPPHPPSAFDNIATLDTSPSLPTLSLPAASATLLASLANSIATLPPVPSKPAAVPPPAASLHPATPSWTPVSNTRRKTDLPPTAKRKQPPNDTMTDDTPEETSTAKAKTPKGYW
jgi:hypothetical protein